MDSIKSVVGDPTKASEPNDLRGDILSAGYYPINGLSNDDTLPVDAVIVGDAEAVTFNSIGTSHSYFDVQIPKFIDTGEDWEIKIGFDMDTSQVGNVRLQLEYASIADAGDTTPTLTTLIETIAAPATLETLKVLTLATIKIPNADLASGNEVTFKFSRLGGDAADTHGGFFRLFSLQLVQTQA